MLKFARQISTVKAFKPFSVDISLERNISIHIIYAKELTEMLHVLL